MDKETKIGNHTLGEILAAQDVIKESLTYIHDTIPHKAGDENTDLVAAFTIMGLHRVISGTLFKETTERISARLKKDKELKANERASESALRDFPISPFRN